MITRTLLILLTCICFHPNPAYAGGQSAETLTYDLGSMAKEDIVRDAITHIQRGDFVFQDAGPSDLLGGASYIPNEAPIFLYDAYKAIIGNVTHCGAVVRRKDPLTGEHALFVCESPADVLRNPDGSPVMTDKGPIPICGLTPLDVWLLRGTGAEFVVCRPKYDPCRFMNSIKIRLFERRIVQWVGRPYDFEFSLANDEVYCSDLIWEAFKHVTGELLVKGTKFAELNCDEPISQPFFAAFFGVDAEGNPNKPWFREIITPVSLINSPKVDMILRFGLEDDEILSEY